MIRLLLLVSLGSLGSLAAANAVPYQTKEIDVKENSVKIVGGSDASIYEYPYQLSLQSDGNHICGASVISAFWSLSASHCVAYSALESLTLRAGSSSRTTGGTIYQVDKAVAHPKSNVLSPDFDLALIKVKTPFVFGRGIQPVRLPEQDESVITDDPATITGWGLLTERGAHASVLQVVHVPVVSWFKCKDVYGEDVITLRMICAGLTEGGKDACQDDSGGAMVVEDKLVGVVSWGEGCGRPDRPGVFSRVANMRDWIRDASGI